MTSLNGKLPSFEKQKKLERLRQARWSFNVAIGSVIIGNLIVLGAVVLLVRGYTRAGAVGFAWGIVSKMTSKGFRNYAKDANKRLDKVGVVRHEPRRKPRHLRKAAARRQHGISSTNIFPPAFTWTRTLTKVDKKPIVDKPIPTESVEDRMAK